MPTFSGTIYKIGINPVIDPPDRVLRSIFESAGRSKGPVPVRGKINGAEFLQTLVKYRGAWRLYINAQMLAASGLAVGDRARIDVEFDPVPRREPVPPSLERALRKNKAAGLAFLELPPSRKKEIYRYLNSLKTAESIDRNVERFLRHLLDEETDGQYGLMRRKTK